MNWKVYAKRVKCPVGLTQVTGCKLVEDLPEPDPNVIAPGAAQADSSFKTGYSTTTMQDCCKPSCAWSDKVTGAEGGPLRRRRVQLVLHLRSRLEHRSPSPDRALISGAGARPPSFNRVLTHGSVTRTSSNSAVPFHTPSTIFPEAKVVSVAVSCSTSST